MSTTTNTSITGWWNSCRLCPHLYYQSCQLLHLPGGWFAKVYNRETAVHNECCCLTRHQHSEVWPWYHIHAVPSSSLVGRQWSDKIPSVCHCLQVCTQTMRSVPTSFCTSRTTSPAFCWSWPSSLSSYQTCHLRKTVIWLCWPICLELFTWQFKRHFRQPYSFLF